MSDCSRATRLFTRFSAISASAPCWAPARWRAPVRRHGRCPPRAQPGRLHGDRGGHVRMARSAPPARCRHAAVLFAGALPGVAVRRQERRLGRRLSDVRNAHRQPALHGDQRRRAGTVRRCIAPHRIMSHAAHARRFRGALTCRCVQAHLPGGAATTGCPRLRRATRARDAPAGQGSEHAAAHGRRARLSSHGGPPVRGPAAAYSAPSQP